jgi:hypothetical protein
MKHCQEAKWRLCSRNTPLIASPKHPPVLTSKRAPTLSPWLEGVEPSDMRAAHPRAGHVVDSIPGTTQTAATKAREHITPAKPLPPLDRRREARKPPGAGQSSRLQLPSLSTTLSRRRLQGGHGVQHVDVAQSSRFWAFAR